MPSRPKECKAESVHSVALPNCLTKRTTLSFHTTTSYAGDMLLIVMLEMHAARTTIVRSEVDFNSGTCIPSPHLQTPNIIVICEEALAQALPSTRREIPSRRASQRSHCASPTHVPVFLVSWFPLSSPLRLYPLRDISFSFRRETTVVLRQQGRTYTRHVC
jgi:hypothetical protein